MKNQPSQKILVDEYREDMRTTLSEYLASPAPTRPMVCAMEEVTERYQTRCKELGIEWADFMDVLGADIGYGTKKQVVIPTTVP